jgi:hypothetical protein
MFDAPNACPRGFRPLLSAWAWGLSAPSSASVAIIERPFSVRHSTFSPSPLGPATTASADSCRPIPTPLGAGSTLAERGQAGRPPRVRRVTFMPYTCRIYARILRVISGFGYFGPLARMRTPHMRFLFVRPALCLQLPSDPASRRRPCCSASGSHHQGPQRTCTSKSSAGYHPGLSVLAHRAPCLAHNQKGRSRERPSHRFPKR